MKRLLTGMLAAALVLSLGVTSAFAAGRGGHHGGGYNFVDGDGDGVCDNYGQATCRHTDADGDGVCDLCGIAPGSGICGCGGNYADADGDGVCDNYGQRVRPMDGTGRGHGCGR